LPTQFTSRRGEELLEILGRHPDRSLPDGFDQDNNEELKIVEGLLVAVHCRPWLWTDATRIMQAAVCGATGSGKTTLLRNMTAAASWPTWRS